ncbi:hypothetical protein NHQ30_008591 [Ciborinia camelliae]|nr:hypothetical protein NHQ30_008591 [Ciborinia camelliae]
MYSYASLSTLSLLGRLIASVNAYPTQSYLNPNSPEALLTSNQQPQTLYTSTTLQTNHPSRSGTLNVHPPPSHNPSHTSSTLAIPFTLTSTCPHLVPNWSYLTSDLLSNILLTYPTGPTSSPYYTFSPGSGSSSSSSSPSSSPYSHDTYHISETVILPTTTQGVEFRSSLHLSVAPQSAAGIGGVTKDEWRSLLGLLVEVDGMLGGEMKGMGFGRLEMSGLVPVLKMGGSKRGVGGRGKGMGMGMLGKHRLGPSDVIGGRSNKGKKEKAEEEGDDEEEEEEEEQEKHSFAWKATWVNYGMVTDRNGKEGLRECAQMPLGLDIDDDTDVDFKRGRGSHGGLLKGEDGEKGREGGSGEERWKIDL